MPPAAARDEQGLAAESDHVQGVFRLGRCGTPAWIGRGQQLGYARDAGMGEGLGGSGLDHGVDRFRVTGQHRFHRSVVAVTDPAVKAAAFGLAQGPRTVAYAAERGFGR